MSHKLTDIIKAVHRAKGTTLIETKDGEVVAIWRREEIKPPVYDINYRYKIETIVLERNPDGSSPIVFR